MRLSRTDLSYFDDVKVGRWNISSYFYFKPSGWQLVFEWKKNWRELTIGPFSIYGYSHG